MHPGPWWVGRRRGGATQEVRGRAGTWQQGGWLCERRGLPSARAHVRGAAGLAEFIQVEPASRVDTADLSEPKAFVNSETHGPLTRSSQP